MSESVIFNSPILLVLYGISLALVLFNMKNRTGAVLTYVSSALTVCSSAYALLLGANLWETAIVIVIFLLINVIKVGEGK